MKEILRNTGWSPSKPRALSVELQAREIILQNLAL